jgi:hypothetical protein
MSSAATTSAASTRATAVVPPAHDAAPETPDPTATVDDLDLSYGRAIVIGSVVGIVVFIAVMWLVVKAIAPEWSSGAVAVIAVWCGIWSGLFLGGTIAVGRWSMRNGH